MSYLTKNDRIVLVTLTSAKLMMKDSFYKMPDEERQLAKEAIDAFDKYRKKVVERLDSRSIKRLQSICKNYEPQLVPKTDVTMNKNVMLPIDYWFDMVAYVMEMKCKNCRGLKRCALRDILCHMNTPEAVIPDGEKIICEYQYLENNDLNWESSLK